MDGHEPVTGVSSGPTPSAATRFRFSVGAVFVLPALALYLGFTILPLVAVFTFSAFHWQGLRLAGFDALANYLRLLAPSMLRQEIARAFFNNCIFFLGTVVLQNSLALGLALLLHTQRRWRAFFRTVIAVPFLVNPLVVGYVWTLLLNPTFGPIAAGLEAVGAGAAIRPWLGDPDWVRPLVILINAWQWTGFPTLVFGAALAAIPEEIFQAALLERASRLQVLRAITLPLMMPTLGAMVVITFVSCFNAFNLQYAVGGVNGAPAGANDVLGLVFYRVAFGGDLNAIGASSALATGTFVFTFAATILLRHMLARLEERVT
jgi:raffinose/stachyose/melibiose transport system permease protein